MAKAERIRKLLDDNGYKEAESILNEWNYLAGWTDKFVQSIEVIHSMKGAAFTAGCMLASQHSTLDMLMYYDARPSAFNGLFDQYTFRPFKGYYPFRMFNTLYRLGEEAECVSDDETVYAVAAKGGKDRAVMVCYYTNDDTAGEKEIEFDFDGAFTVQLLDEENTCTEIPFAKKLTLKRNSVLLLTSR